MHAAARLCIAVLYLGGGGIRKEGLNTAYIIIYQETPMGGGGGGGTFDTNCFSDTTSIIRVV